MANHLARSSRMSKRRNRCAKQKYSSQYARLRDTIKSQETSETFHFLTLTLCQDNYAVLLKTPRANSPTISILAEATYQEGTRVAVRKSLRRTTRTARSGSRLSARVYLGIYQGEMCTKRELHRGSWFQKSRHPMEAPRVEDRLVSAQRCEAPL